MDSLHTPYLKGEDTLRLAIIRMKESQSPAIVIGLGEKYVLYTSRVVFLGYSSGLNLCNELNVSQGLGLLNLKPFDESKNYILDFTSEKFQQDRVEKLMAKENYNYGFLYGSERNKDPNMALVVTRFETHKKEIMGNNIICVCKGSERHLVEGVNGLDGKSCKICANTYDCTVSK